MPLPDRDFDPGSVSLIWRSLRDRGIEVRFATVTGQEAVADARMLTGEELDLWSFVPSLRRVRLLGLALRASKEARIAYRQLWADPYFQHPATFKSLQQSDFDGMVLTAGHRARGVQEFLENPNLQRFVGAFFATGKPVAAIAQGVLLAARSASPFTGRSALYGRKTTALSWALERRAVRISRWFGRFWDAKYFRLYVETGRMKPGALSIEAQVIAALENKEDFIHPARSLGKLLWTRSGFFRDTKTSSRAAHVVIDDTYVSARWQGDAHSLARAFIALLAAHHDAGRVTNRSRYFVEDETHHNERSRAWT